MITAKRMTNLMLSNFFEELAMLTKSGMSVNESLTIMRDGTDINSEKEFFSSLIAVVATGSPLSAAIKKSGIFPDYAVKMSEIGEKTGRHDSIFKSLGAYYKQNDSLVTNLKSAATYPVVMLLVILAVIFVLFSLVMPVFDRVYETLGVNSAQQLTHLLQVGYIFSTVALIIGALVISVLVCFMLLSATKKGRESLETLFNNSFLTAGLSNKIAAHRFAYAMSLMLSGGLSFDSAIALTLDIIKNKKMLTKIKKLRYLMDVGESFSDAVAKSEVFDSSYTGMVSAAVRSGQVDSTMLVIASRYEESVNRRVSGIVGAVEPALVTVLSVIVGLVLMSIVVPLIGIMTSML